MGRELLRNESHWQIMGGEDMRVWVDRWLPSLPAGHPMPLGEVVVTTNLRVNSLICPLSHEWDISFLQRFLSAVAQVAIRDMPLGDPRRNDQLVWVVSKNDRYSIKSGYRWIQSRTIGLRDHRQSGI